jgi:hypothetical protein
MLEAGAERCYGHEDLPRWFRRNQWIGPGHAETNVMVRQQVNVPLRFMPALPMGIYTAFELEGVSELSLVYWVHPLLL